MQHALRFLNYFRLALFVFGYGLLGVLVTSTLNRIMIAELGYPASLVGLLIAIPYLISPVRLWLGYRSDGFTIFGRRREPYIVLGALLAGLGLAATVLMIVNSAGAPWLMAGTLLGFALFGLGRNLGHNSFEALLADVFTGDARPRAATLYEVAALLGSVMGGGLLGRALETYDPGRLVAVTLGTATVAFVLSLLAALGQEPRTTVTQVATEKARGASFRAAVRDVVLADPQVRLFFTLVFFTFIGTLAQDALLEPYGALVLNMDVGQTTRLTVPWGLGVMAAMLLSGLVLIKWLGYLNVMRAGIVASLAAFAGIIFAGASEDVGLFRNLVLFMGLGTGLAGAGMLTGALNFTTTIRAGLLMGVWGMANLLGKAAGNVIGGGVVDVVQLLTGSRLAAYSAVFALEIVMLAAALGLSFRLNVAASRAKQEARQTLQATAAD